MMESTLDFDTFVARLKDLLALEPEAASPYTSLYDEWELDSLHVFQVLVITEAIAGAEVPPPELPELTTLGDVYDYYVSLLECEVEDSW